MNTILVVDDDSHIRKLIRIYLEKINSPCWKHQTVKRR